MDIEYMIVTQHEVIVYTRSNQWKIKRSEIAQVKKAESDVNVVQNVVLKNGNEYIFSFDRKGGLLFRVPGFVFSNQNSLAVTDFDVNQLQEFLDNEIGPRPMQIVPMFSNTLASTVLAIPVPLASVPVPSSIVCPSIFFDRQDELQSCGRRALNNMIGTLRFVKQGSNSKTLLQYTSDPRSVPDQVSTLDLCKQFETRQRSDQRCNPNEWQADSFLEDAARLQGFSLKKYFGKASAKTDILSVVGTPGFTNAIFNIGRSHWTAFKFYRGLQWQLDSMAAQPECFASVASLQNRLGQLDLTLGMFFRFHGHPVPQKSAVDSSSDSDEVEEVAEVAAAVPRPRQEPTIVWPTVYRKSSDAFQVPMGLNVTQEIRDDPDPSLGRGMFVLQDMPKGTLITEQDGQILSQEEAKDKKRTTHSVTITLGSRTVIDGLDLVNSLILGSDGRYQPKSGLEMKGQGAIANSARDTPQEPNADFFALIDDLGLSKITREIMQVTPKRVFLRATRDIARGSQVFLNQNPTEVLA